MARPTDKFLRAFRGYKRSRLCFCLRRDETRRTIIPPISAGPPASENSGIGTVSELSEDGGLPSYSNVTVVPATKPTRRLNLWVARRVTAFAGQSKSWLSPVDTPVLVTEQIVDADDPSDCVSAKVTVKSAGAVVVRSSDADHVPAGMVSEDTSDAVKKQAFEVTADKTSVAGELPGDVSRLFH